MKHFIIRKIADRHELDEVNRLTYHSLLNAYVISPNPEQKISLFPQFDDKDDTIVFAALDQDRIIGTISFTPDTPPGLVTDLYFKEETDMFRHKNVKLASAYRIATGQEYQHYRSLSLDLIGTIVSECGKQAVDVCLLNVRPKFINVYRRLLNATVICEKKKKVIPAMPGDMVLLAVDVHNLPPRFDRVLKAV